MQYRDGGGDALSVSALGQCSACHEGAGLAFPCVLGAVSASAPRAWIHVCTADTVGCLHRSRAVCLASAIHGVLGVLGHTQGLGDLGDANARCCGHGGHGKHLRRITPGESLAVERCAPKPGCRAQQWVNCSIVRHCECSMRYIICLSCLGHVGVRRIHSTCWGLRVVAAVMRSFGQCINVFKCGSSEIQAGLDCILRNVFVLLDVAKGGIF